MNQSVEHAGRLAENVMHFGRVLRAAGMPVGTHRIQLALEALQVAAGCEPPGACGTGPGGASPAWGRPGGWLESRTDFRDVLAACLIDRAEQRELFEQAFALFWRDPDLLGRALAMLLPRVQANLGEHKPPGAPPENRRLAAALFPHMPHAPQHEPPQRTEVDAALTWSERELLHKADFETMSADEWAAAKRALRALDVLFEPLATRRSVRAPHPGRADWRATLQAMARHGGELWDMRWRRPRMRPAPLVVIADISGSMSRYSRMLLHFAHALVNARGGARAKVEAFVFGTRLTRTTRALRQRDPDVAIAQVMRDVVDWSGGTRLTACLHEFNRHWARRVLPGSATVLLITDGLEHGDTAALGFEAERLRKSCRRLWWLNPLLRYEGFEPRAAGIRAMLAHVDRLLPAHNLQSLEQLAHLLAGADDPRGAVAGRAGRAGAGTPRHRAGQDAPAAAA